MNSSKLFMLVITFIWLWLAGTDAHAQGVVFGPSTSGLLNTGMNTGYRKAIVANFPTLKTKQIGRGNCNNVGFHDSLFGGVLNPAICLLINNRDTTAKKAVRVAEGRYFGFPYSAYGWITRPLIPGAACIACKYQDYSKRGIMSTLNEYVLDSAYVTAASLIYDYVVDTSMQSITQFEGPGDILKDSLSYLIDNINPTASGLIWRLAAPWGQGSLMYSRVFRYHDYANISSPEETNRNILAAVRGRPTRYSFGYKDAELDSIRVTPLQWRVSIGQFNPLYTKDSVLAPSFYNYVKLKLRDSIVNLAYKPGYSPTNPFGPGSTYSLDEATGDISFTAPDTGLFFLAYRVTEYRDGLPLGDIMTYRIAYVIDSVGITLPSLNQPSAITGGTYDTTTKLMVVCPGQSINFNMGAGSTLAGSKIKLESNLTQSCAGSTVTYSGQGTMTPNLSFSWTPTINDAGYHYVFVSAIDTACGPGHKPVSVSRGFRILAQRILYCAEILR